MLSVDELVERVQRMPGMAAIAQILLAEQIDEEAFFLLSHAELHDLGIVTGPRVKITALLRGSRPTHQPHSIEGLPPARHGDPTTGSGAVDVPSTTEIRAATLGSIDGPPASTAPAVTARYAGPVPRARVDDHYSGGGEVVQEDGINWAVNLNQTSFDKNYTKYYIIQLIKQPTGGYAFFTRWGRIGEPGQNATMVCAAIEGAKAQFISKFKDKTGNNWEDIRVDPSKFVARTGLYTMIDVDVEDMSTVATVVRPQQQQGGAAAAAPVQHSALHPKVQDVLRIIFDTNMFKKQLVEMKIDLMRLPLRRLRMAQIQGGYRTLEEMNQVLEHPTDTAATRLQELSMTFYTLIPHDFGRNVPPVIRTLEMVKEKFDLLNVLADIQTAVSMEAAAEASELEENPLDRQFKELDCGIDYVDPSSDEFKIIERYTQETQGYRKCEIVNVFRVDRPFDKERCETFKHLGNRRLLWYGTNISVVAAILKTGLRIMPHAGGRVGKGLYFASENGKSAAYVRPDGNTGFMFLNEVILGNAKEINQDDSSLNQHKVEVTYGADSIIARGRTEPDPAQDITIQGEWGPITVPQGKPIPQPKWSNSTFAQSEYLVYDEGKVRVKYILQMHF